MIVIRKLFISALFILITVSMTAQNSQAMSAMRKDYPKLMSLYGDRISGQKAHYIFVVDVSSSMLPYETVVKDNFLQFMNAVPDGDQVSLIKMSDESHTGFVGLLKCTPLDQTTRASIKEVVNGFRFNKNGSSEDGSDGFTMAKSVIDAINVVGSNDLTFVYMLTDFEYWTHKFKYEKSKENWSSLTSLLPEAKMDGMCKYGIELNSGENLRQEAIFKNELDRVFGKVEYQSVGSAALLSNWFSHIAASVMSVKLNSLLKEDWKQVVESINSDVAIAGDEVSFNIDATNTPLVSGATMTMNTENCYITPVESEGTFPGSVIVGKLVRPSSEKSFFPCFIQMGGDNYEAKIVLHSPYAEEINRLQGVCGEGAGQNDAVNFTYIDSGSLPSARAWNSFIPVWCWLLILLMALIVLGSQLYKWFVLNTKHHWIVSVKEDDNLIRCRIPNFVAPFSIGAKGDYEVPDVSWSLDIKGKKYNPLLFWKRSGYYASWKGGTATVKDKITKQTLTGLVSGEEAFLCSLHSGPQLFVEKSGYRIDLCF